MQTTSTHHLDQVAEQLASPGMNSHTLTQLAKLDRLGIVGRNQKREAHNLSRAASWQARRQLPKVRS